MKRNIAEFAPTITLAGLFFFSFFIRVVFSPILPAIEKDLSLTHTQAAAFLFFIYIGFSMAMFLSGFLSGKINHHRTIFISIPIVYLIGNGFFPAVLGIFGDKGSFATGFALAGIIFTLSAAFTFALKSPER
ncbi:MAG: hypothetical protein AB1798_17615 [Spirochaetota bacterium]